MSTLDSLTWTCTRYCKKERKKVKLLSRVRIFANPWTVGYQAPPWDFPGKNTGVDCHFLLIFKMDKQQGSTVYHMEHCSM